MIGLPSSLAKFKILKSWSTKFWSASMNTRTIWDLEIASIVFTYEKNSMLLPFLFFFRIPAVSIRVKFWSSSLKGTSILSMVVPGVFETITLLSLVTEFIKVDLPLLGLPITATWILSLSLRESIVGLIQDLIVFIF